MNPVACLETVVVLVFSFCLFCADSTLVKGPSDTSVFLGGTVKLECFTTDRNYPPAWSQQKVGSGEKTHVSVVSKQGDLIVPKVIDSYRERFSFVEDRDTGEYSLQITDAKPEDAGSYTCAARGGLTEKRSAQLSVVEPFPVCASNITDALGENDCHKEPDVVEFSCKFRGYGNYLPKIAWSDVNQPEKAILIDTPTTDATGMASSKLIIKGNYVGLDKTSFRCVVGSSGNAGDNRFDCLTPKINVIKISHLPDSRTLIAPEEVECTGWSKLNASGCEWLRRDEDNDHHHHPQETHVTSKPLLNLHRSDMKAGTYTCVAECNIRGEKCRVNLLSVSYQPPQASDKQSGTVPVVIGLVAAVVGAAIIVAIIVFFIRKRSKKRGVGRTGLPMTLSTNGITSQQDNPSLPESLERSDSGISSQQDTPPLPESLTQSDNRFTSQQETPLLSDPDVSIDIPDAKLGGPTNLDRARLAEERALARMRANVAGKSGETNQAFTPHTDVAEGVAADKTKHE